jgi:protein-disulfide isomerase-like protein with CxxC motif
VVAGFDHAWSLRAAEADFARVRRMAVAAFPTLLLSSGGRTIPVMAGSATARQVEERLSALLRSVGRHTARRRVTDGGAGR